ncbi:hypothetical protein KDH_66190 [Dictyobacter sp. S3.2.2.5]|uniref:NACHT domain-containing protein n=1 Tax=Dictyobacter halimunensis TaxID=3026934 RepID=A0ABQ6G1A3_9CHLR|nr:hypothetical protein KDH_66190 [Dictyobacter sp. S3.2.2.5]
MTKFDQRYQQVHQQYNAGHDINMIASPSLSEMQQKRNRSRMLAKVRAYWITNVLEHSLHGAAMIELGLHEQPDAVAHPWELIVQSSDQPTAHALPPGTRLTHLYDEAGGELLVLGEPGAGKTTLLLELARDLLDRADQDTMHPIPVIFNLTSWSVKRPPLAHWLIEELNSKYQVPRKLAQQWIEADQLLLLLDGLDEVTQVHRATCIEAINTYRHEHGLVPMVICSRKADYLSQIQRVQLHTAVVIQSLTEDQIETYLSRAGKPMEAVRMVIRNDPELQEMARSPLMLSILTLAYAGKSHQEIQVAGVPRTRQQVFKAYIKRMLQRRNFGVRYPQKQAIHRLAWLAHQLARHNLTEFYLERMQPDWFDEHQQIPHFYRVVVRTSTVGIGLLAGLISGLLMALIAWLVFRLNPHTALINGLVAGPTTGLIVGLTQQIEREIKPAEVIIWSWHNVWQILTKTGSIRSMILGGLIIGLVFGLPIGWAFGLVDGLAYGWILGWFGGFIIGLVDKAVSILLYETQAKQLHPVLSQDRRGSVRNRFLIGLVSALVVGLISLPILALLIVPTNDPMLIPIVILICGLVGGLVIGFNHHVNKEVKSVEILSWLRVAIWQKIVKNESWRQIIIVTLATGLAFGTAIGLGAGLIHGVVSSIISGVIFDFISLLLGGLSNDRLDKQIFTRPNQGMRYSTRNSILVGLVVGLVAGLVNGLIIGWLNGLDTSSMLVGIVFGLITGMVTGLATGFSIGLSNGGTAGIQHIVLRWFLWRVERIPWRYSRFLDYATEHILLRKVGGGYIFIHRLLLDYFASLYTPSLERVQEGPGSRLTESRESENEQSMENHES